jgi:hypothetical protein
MSMRNYKDVATYRERTQAYKTKYRAMTGSGKCGRKKWTEKEIRLIVEHKYPDRELARMLGRSVQAIQTKRTRYTGGKDY